MKKERQSLSSIGRQYGGGEGFGHADYNAAMKAGYTNQEVKSWIDSDQYRKAEIQKNKNFYDQVTNNNVNASQAGKTTKKVDPDSKFDGDAYFAANKDVANWWEDSSKAGIHSGAGTYSKAHGKNTDGWEESWLKGMNKKYGTQYDDVAGFSKNQFARYHYSQHGIDEGRKLRLPEEKKAAVQANPAPAAKPQANPAPVQAKPAVEKRPENIQFIKPQPVEQVKPQDFIETPPQQKAAPRKPKKEKRMAGGEEFRQNLETVRKPERVDQFKRQVNRESSFSQKMSQMENAESDSIYNKYVNANRQAQFGRKDGTSIADKYIFKANESNPIDIVALDKHIRRGPMYHEAKSELAGLLTYGDRYRNSRENPNRWAQPNPMEAVEKPDFMSFYKQTKKDIDSIDI